MRSPPTKPELLAPAGNLECARAAVANGADAVYFGLPSFNARMRADNFTAEDLPGLMSFLHENGVRGYAAFNTLIFTGELEAAAAQLAEIERAGVDAVIVQDLGLARMTRELTPGLGLHASTQMTITSPEGLALVDEAFHLDKAVIARENSLREIHLFRTSGLAEVPLETFVHGALCVAYSGQCLTSESLGQRSANRGECAQACRMTYDLVVDGEDRDLGDRKYLLSPQDLAGVDLIPRLIEEGVASFKIEGRLKSPEYVAAVTRVYRKAIDHALGETREHVDGEDRYELEMTFSRGFHTGWLEGIDNQSLVHARFGKKRGAFVGRVTGVGRDWIEVTEPRVPLSRGDGLVVDTGGDTNREQGGRIFELRGNRIFFLRGKLDPSRIAPGDRIWKTDDPALRKRIEQTWKTGRPAARGRTPLRWKVAGRAGEPLRLSDVDSGLAVSSSRDLVPAHHRPLDHEFLFGQWSRLGDTGFRLESLDSSELAGGVMLPVSELNRMRRELVARLESEGPRRREDPSPSLRVLDDLLPTGEEDCPLTRALRVLCRDEAQIDAALECGVEQIYIDLEDVRRYRDVVASIRERDGGVRIFLATPRIQKAGEAGLFRVVDRAAPDGVLVRNLGGAWWFARESDLAMVGDFSLNVANPLAARFFMERGFENLTASYDLNIEQLVDLLRESPPHWFEVTLHQHMPLFHMEHCVFCAFLSQGTDSTNCGRPCDRHEVQLRDRVGQLHTLKADVGCRNTLFNGRAQTGARYFDRLRQAGLRAVRVELLGEKHAEAVSTITTYRELLEGKTGGEELWRRLEADSRLGVVEGSLSIKRP